LSAYLTPSSLTQGEIIQLSEPMTMMFEPEDLAVASPATVSRCGMIYMEPNSLGFDVLFQSWLNKLPHALGSKTKSILSALLDTYVGGLLPHMRRHYIEPLPTVNNCLVEALLNLLGAWPYCTALYNAVSEVLCCAVLTRYLPARLPRHRRRPREEDPRAD
jgi:hypothetical protein